MLFVPGRRFSRVSASELNFLKMQTVVIEERVLLESDMTWFEAEQIDMYLEKLESLLDDWRLEPIQMRLENTELLRILGKVESVSKGDIKSPLMRRYLSDLHHRIAQCSDQIQERLRR